MHSGKIVTAAGASAGIDLGLWLAGKVAGQEQAKMIQLYLEYDPQPPFNAGHPRTASAPVVGRTRALARSIAVNPAEMRAVPPIVWGRVLERIRKHK